MTLLPVLYQSSGFGGSAPTEGQRRFIRSTDNMLRLLERLKSLCDAQGARLGLAPHSLRAVPPDVLREVLAGLSAILALGIGSTGAYFFLTKVMESSWVFDLPLILGILLLSLLLAVGLGFAGSWRALGARAAPYLRNE